VAFGAGGVLIVWSSFIHFHLWQKVGYRNIPTIGPLFILQSVAGLILGLLVAFVHRLWSAVLGIGFVVSTMVGFVISVEHGLFGFRDAWSSPFAHMASLVEIATVAVLGLGVAVCLVAPRVPADPSARWSVRQPG
jgi:uncharacterized protein YacL